jgi:hypothetical protein
MRKILVPLFLSFVVVSASLTFVDPVRAQSGLFSSEDMTPAQRKKVKRTQVLVTAGVITIVAAAVGIFISLNYLERKRERERLMRLHMERMEKGLS